MKRIIISLIIFFVILFGSAWFIMNDASSLLSFYLSSRLGVKVKVRKISFHPQGITIKGFKIKNPEGSPLPDAFRVQTININAKWVSYFRNPIEIDLVSFDDVYLSMLLPKEKKIACNWIKILNSLDEETTVIRRTKRSFKIEKLVVDKLRVELYTVGKKTEIVGPIKRIEIDHINSEEGLPLRTFTKAIMNEMMKKIFSLKIIQTAISSILTLPFSILEFIFKPTNHSKHPCDEIYKPEGQPPAQKNESLPRGGGDSPSVEQKSSPDSSDQKKEETEKTPMSA
jgi:hypothetical protein